MRQLVLPRSQPILDLALSPDGQTLAVAHRNFGVSLYDPFDGRVKLDIRGYFSRLVFGADGRWLVAMRPVVVLIDTTTSPPTWVQPVNARFAQTAAFEPDDCITFVNHLGLQTFQLAAPPNPAGAAVELQSLSLANRPVPLRDLWGLGPGVVVGLDRLTPQTAEGYVPVAFDPVGQRLTAVIDAPLECRMGLDGHGTYRSHGDWFALAATREVLLYHWSDFSGLTPPPAPIPRRRSLWQALRESVFGTPAEVRFQERYGSLPTLQPRWRIPLSGQRPADPLPVAFLPNGRNFLCRGANAAIELRDLATGQVQQSWQFQRAWPRVLAVAPDGLTAMAAVKGGGVTFWDLE